MSQSGGFDLFADRLERAGSDGRPRPVDALKRMGQAYLDFARQEPAYYSAMFEAALHRAMRRTRIFLPIARFRCSSAPARL